jgi:hypothetical protein
MTALEGDTRQRSAAGGGGVGGGGRAGGAGGDDRAQVPAARPRARSRRHFVPLPIHFTPDSQT